MQDNLRHNMSYASHVLSGAAFKVLYFLREYTLKKKKTNQSFDGWISMSYNQLREKTGLSDIAKPIMELQEHTELIKTEATSGISNRYKLLEWLL
jgi:hypothetical protein